MTIKIRACCTFSLLLSAHLDSQVITDPSLLNPAAALVDFEDFPVGTAANPLVLGPVTFSAGPGLGVASVARWAASGTEVTDKHPAAFFQPRFPAVATRRFESTSRLR